MASPPQSGLRTAGGSSPPLTSKTTCRLERFARILGTRLKDKTLEVADLFPPVRESSAAAVRLFVTLNHWPARFSTVFAAPATLLWTFVRCAVPRKLSSSGSTSLPRCCLRYAIHAAEKICAPVAHGQVVLTIPIVPRRRSHPTSPTWPRTGRSWGSSGNGPSQTVCVFCFRKRSGPGFPRPLCASAPLPCLAMPCLAAPTRAYCTSETDCSADT